MRKFCLLFVCLAACAPRAQSPQQATTAPQLTADAFIAADGAALPLSSWLPARPPKAVVLALHGFNDYRHAFESTGLNFAQHGIAVYAYDQRGFGAATEPGVWPAQENLVDDVRNAALLLHARYPGLPLFVMGESMGAALAIVALSRPDFPAIDGVILESPAVWGSQVMNPLYRSVLWLGAHTVPYNRLTGSDLRILASNNIPMLRAMAADPRVIKKTRIDAIYGLVGLMGNAYDDIPQLKLPVLLLYGGHDQVIPREPVRGALQRFTVPVEFVFYPGGYHMLIRDVEGKVVQDDMIGWIDNRAAPLPSGLGKLREPGK